MMHAAQRKSSPASIVQSLPYTSFLLLVWLGLAGPVSHGWALDSELVYTGPDNRLHYRSYPNQGETLAINTLPDFSTCGYAGGGVPIPTPHSVMELSPRADGDDTARIQAALDTVAARTPDAQGFRGALLLRAGHYRLASGLTIKASGVVLRGEGQDELGTVLEATTPADYTVITVGSGSGSYSALSGTTRAITSTYVPVGATSFTVESTAGYAPNDPIVVLRTPNDYWIDDLDMRQWGWTASGYATEHERVITAINGNTITIDVPLVDAMQEKYGGGKIYKSAAITRLHHCGVENLRLESCYASATDEEHPWNAIKVNYLENGWVTGVTAVYFAYACVNAGSYARYITVADCAMLDPKSIITGGRRYSFNIEGAATRILFLRCFSSQARHDFVAGSRTRGPNAFVDCIAVKSNADSGPHHRWSTGILFDNVWDSSALAVENRGPSGSGHGWSGAQILFWNCKTAAQKCDAPKGAMNFAIGSKAKKTEGSWFPAEPFGWWEFLDQTAAPRSLYFAQLTDRLGQTAAQSVAMEDQIATGVWPLLQTWAGKDRLQPSPIQIDSPHDQPLAIGRTLRFEVTPLAGAAITGYRWYEINGSQYLPIGTDAPILELKNGTANDLGRRFFCRIQTSAGPYWSATATVVPVQADLNNDHRVDLDDFSYLSQQWLTDGAASPSALIMARTTGAQVDRNDLAALAANWLLAEQAPILLRAEDFEGHAIGGAFDGTSANGLRGGFWDTESENTGNCAIEANNGSQVLRFMSLSSGGARGAALAGLDDPIANDESGMLFFRFMIRADSQPPCSYLGLHALTGTNPLTTTPANNPATALVAGFAALDDGAGQYRLTTTNGTTVLKPGMERGQWYNCWIVANHATDRFDLFIAAIDAPGGAATLPTETERVATGLSFGVSTSAALTGAMFVCPATPIQSSRTYIDDIYWNGSLTN